MKFMNKLIIGLCSSALLLTGCSSTSSTEPKYDEVELIRYQECIDFYLKGALDKNAFFMASEDYTNQAKDACSKLLPIKK